MIKDWIYWYTGVLFAVTVLGLMFNPDDYNRTLQHRVIDFVFYIPIAGRVLGFW